MGIIILPERKHKCSKCGSLNCQPYSEPPASKYTGHYKGVACLNCGHKSRYYKQSIFEQEMGGGNSYSWSSNEPQEF